MPGILPPAAAPHSAFERREREDEGGAPTVLAGRPDLTAVGAHDLARDGEPEPVPLRPAWGPVDGSGTIRARPVEALEEVRHVLLRDADPGIAHGHLHDAGLEVPRGDAYGAALLGVAEGVVEQVVEYLFQAVEVARDVRVAMGTDVELDAGVLGAPDEDLADVVEELVQAQVLLAHVHLARLD